jgi:cysteine desulfurase
MDLPIYLDYHSTTPIDVRVLDAMLPFYRSDFGNAASANHGFGKRAYQAVEDARAKIAHLINAASPEEIIFTSGTTESNNFALKGIAAMYQEKGNHIITSAIEHKSVLEVCRFLEQNGFQVTYLPVNSEGIISLEELQRAITPKTILISLMHANNEIGTIQPLIQVGRFARQHDIFFHCDGAQTAGRISVDVQAANIDLLSFSAHKMYGPKGVGALYVRKKDPRVRLEPLIHGGGQERDLRSGTLNVAAVVGFGKAAEIADQEMESDAVWILHLREKLREGIQKQLTDTYVHGNIARRLAGNLNISFAYVEGETLLNALTEEIAVSSGSACASQAPGLSYVLKALGTKEELIHTSIRFGLGRFNTEEEIDYTIKRVTEIVNELRRQSPIYKKETAAKVEKK